MAQRLLRRGECSGKYFMWMSTTKDRVDDDWEDEMLGHDNHEKRS